MQLRGNLCNHRMWLHHLFLFVLTDIILIHAELHNPSQSPSRVYPFCLYKGLLKNNVVTKIFSHIERLCRHIGRHNIHSRQKLQENDEFNGFFTNCHVYRPPSELEEAMSHTPETGKPTMLAVARISRSTRLPHWFW